MSTSAKIIRRIFFIILGVGAVAIIYFAYMVGGKIQFSKQWPLYEALRNTAAIIFAVVGAWLAIIYPDRLKFSFGSKNEKPQEKDAPSKLNLLFIPAIHSTLILVILLLIGILAPIAKEFEVFQSNIEISRRISFVLLTVLTLYQAIIVVLAILPAGFLAHSAAKEEIQAKQASILSRAKAKSRYHHPGGE